MRRWHASGGGLLPPQVTPLTSHLFHVVGEKVKDGKTGGGGGGGLLPEHISNTTNTAVCSSLSE